MRVIVVAILVIVAVWIVIAGLKNSKRVSFFVIFLLLAPAGASAYFEYKWVETQTNISAAVKTISGLKGAELKCQRMSEGFFDVWAHTQTLDEGALTVGLKYNTCASLISWYNGDTKSSPTPEQITAVHLLTHETIRITGQTDLNLQECLAMKNDAAMALALGATANQANYLAIYYKQNIHPVEAKKLQEVYC